MAEIGEKVLVDCVATLGDGRVFLNTHDAGEPLCVTVGAQTFPPLVERALFNMLPGDECEVQLSAAQAFGDYDDALVQRVPATLIAGAAELPVGSRVKLRTRAGEVDAKVASVQDGEVVLDCNHEFAGQDATYALKLVSVVHDSAIQRELHPAGCACGCDKLKAQLSS